MAKDSNTVSVPKMTQGEAVIKARDLLHRNDVSHENEKLFNMSLQLVLLSWRELGLIVG